MSNLIPKTILGSIASPFTRNNDLFNFDESFFGNLKSIKTNYGENENEYFVQLQTPGFSKEDLAINFEDDTLIVSASVENESESSKNNFYRKDFSSSSFKKSFLLPEDINKDEIKAELKNGILNIVVPKNGNKELAVSKKIEIK